MAFNPLAALWHNLRALRRAYLNRMNAAYSEEELRRRFPDMILGREVMVKRIDRFYAGKRVIIDDRAYLNCAGGVWNGGKGHVRLGDNCEIGPYVTIWGAGGVTIGSNVHIGPHTVITAHESRHIKPDDENVWKPLDFNFGEIVIEDHVLICAHVTITPGVRIGRHAMIGAGAVVIRDVPDNCLYAGVPAHFIRELRPGENLTFEPFNPLVAPT
jgi:UDP-2-acetamido-3-amino-2,3-dideoxy-glucuronate N-acetyltransferase